jgi:hypothetical protein
MHAKDLLPTLTAALEASKLGYVANYVPATNECEDDEIEIRAPDHACNIALQFSYDDMTLNEYLYKDGKLVGLRFARIWEAGSPAAEIVRETILYLSSRVSPAPPEVAVIVLDDMAAWEKFADDNEEALVQQYGSVKRAYQHVLQGGLRMGGGACPISHICFKE